MTTRKRKTSRRKTFGRVPIGGLFTLKDDPANALLMKMSKKKYRVIKARKLESWQNGIDSSKGLVCELSPTATVKQGRQE